jgi:predicted MFS family arabinose efflux permease
LVTAYGLIAFMAAIRFLQVAGIGAGATFFNVYMDNELMVATAQIGLIAATARLVAVPAALIGPSLSRRFGFGATAVFASAVAGLSLIPLALVPQPGIAGLGFIGLMSFTSMRYPAFYVYMMERTPERLRSIMNGANEMAAGLSFSLVALVGGYVIVNYGYAATFLGGAILTLIGTAIFAVYVRLRGETVVEAPTVPAVT